MNKTSIQPKLRRLNEYSVITAGIVGYLIILLGAPSPWGWLWAVVTVAAVLFGDMRFIKIKNTKLAITIRLASVLCLLSVPLSILGWLSYTLIIDW